MKVPLVAVPPEVVIAMCPVLAPVGTVASTSVSEITVNSVAFTPPKLTVLVCVRLTPVMVTTVPTVPLVGVKLVICGVTRNAMLLLRGPVEIRQGSRLVRAKQSRLPPQIRVVMQGTLCRILNGVRFA